MHRRNLVALLAGLSAIAACSTLSVWGQQASQEKLVGGPTVLHFSVPFTGFLGGQTTSAADGTAVACYGILKLAGKPRYTYLVLFKADPKKHKGGGIGMGDPPGTFNGRKAVYSLGPTIEADLPLWVACGVATFEFTYKLKADAVAGKVLTESIKIGGKEYDKDIPRVFLVDLTSEKQTCMAVKTTEALPVPELSGGMEKLEQAIGELKKRAEVREFFQDKRESR